MSRIVLGAGALTLVLVAVDGGSVALTKMSVPDNVKRAGYAAAEVAKGEPPNRHTAAAAYESAQSDANRHGITIRRGDFTLYPGGKVTLTAEKTAPTLLLKRIPQLEDLAVVTATTTVEPLPFS